MELLLAMMVLLFSGVSCSTTFFTLPEECEAWNNKIDGAVVKNSDTNLYSSKTCALTLEPQDISWSESRKLMIGFTKLDIQNCDVKLELYYGSRVSGFPNRAFNCHDPMPTDIMYPGKYITLQFVYQSSGSGTASYADFEFEITITAYKDSGSCDYDFLCDNNKCIDNFLTCDGVDNCMDNSDEADRGQSNCDISGIVKEGLKLTLIVIIVIIVIGILSCIGCVICIAVCCKRRRSAGTVLRTQGQGQTTTTYVHNPAPVAQQTYTPAAQPMYPTGQVAPPPQGPYPPPQQQAGYPPPQQPGAYPPPQSGGYPGPPPATAPSAPYSDRPYTDQPGGYAPVTYNPPEEKVRL